MRVYLCIRIDDSLQNCINLNKPNFPCCHELEKRSLLITNLELLPRLIHYNEVTVYANSSSVCVNVWLDRQRRNSLTVFPSLRR